MTTENKKTMEEMMEAMQAQINTLTNELAAEKERTSREQEKYQLFAYLGDEITLKHWHNDIEDFKGRKFVAKIDNLEKLVTRCKSLGYDRVSFKPGKGIFKVDVNEERSVDKQYVTHNNKDYEVGNIIETYCWDSSAFRSKGDHA